MKERRQELRRKPTPQEKLLWAKLKGSQIGFKFIRQYSVDNFVLDFYCPEKSLGIELYGYYHLKNSKYDEFRLKFFENVGIKVIIFWNREIDGEIEKVIKIIKSTLLLSPPQPPSYNKRGVRSGG